MKMKKTQKVDKLAYKIHIFISLFFASGVRTKIRESCTLYVPLHPAICTKMYVHNTQHDAEVGLNCPKASLLVCL